MKVDIITRHSVPNYGSLLQAYSTQKIIEDLGYEAEIINYTKYEERCNNLAKTLIKGKKWDKNFFTRLIYKIIQVPNYRKMYKAFEKYRKGFLKETQIEYGSLEELENNPPKADVYCSGSDQIWGKIGTEEYDKSYFLEFAKNKRCISYASSFGKTGMSNKLDKNLENLLKKYETILVRENSAKEIIESKGFENVEVVLDPTLLVKKEEWEKLAKSNTTNKEKYVLVYQLHNNKAFEKYAKEFAKKVNKELIRISPSIHHIAKPGKLLYLPNQYEFLYYFKNADYILTDSFHATVFSIIFNKEFVNISPGETSTRITSLLELFNIKNRVLKNYNDFSFMEKKIDYEDVNKILEEKREESIKLLKNAIEHNEKNINLMNIHKKCCGCRTCEQICPKGAIQIIENEEGFLEPVVDKNKCINCGLCVKKCPQIQDIVVENKLENEDVYAAKNKNANEQKQSSSGGIFLAIANYILENDGAVYGASFNENLELKHIRITKKDKLELLKGSKYLQSNNNSTYSQVKKDLEDGKKVLYVSTPCQIAGLRSFLSKTYENLLVIDLVCHGVPSQKLFNKYLEWLSKKAKDEIVKYEFRNKDISSWGSNSKVTFRSGKVKYIDQKIDRYYQNFSKGNIFRECCYNCKYAKTERIGDITIADFWGIEKEHPDFYDKNGVSAIFVNTKKGKEVFEHVKDNICFIESTVQKVAKENENLNGPVKRSVIRNVIYNDIEKDNYIKKNLKYKKDLKAIVKLLISPSLKGRN